MAKNLTKTDLKIACMLDQARTAPTDKQGEKYVKALQNAIKREEKWSKKK